MQLPRLTVIGSRKVTPYGRSVTTSLVRAAAEQGIVIISGLAIGTDTLAHQAALDAGGKTIAILPCGLDSPYPASNRPLARRILTQGGALISEYPEGSTPFKQNFIARNRLVSGIADGILVTEAAEKSGTLHTINFALSQGKTVMAVPGPITSDLSRGTNNLIRAGATPITKPEDIFEALGVEMQTEDKEILGANEHESVILQLLKRGISEANELQALSKLEAAIFNQTLTMLEITGKVRPLGAGHWSLC